MHQNYVRMHRRESGLSQRDLARILGYSDQWQISRHERSRSNPTLRTALAYEAVFGRPVASIFIEIMTATVRDVEAGLAVLEDEWRRRGTAGRSGLSVRQKLQWLEQRRNLE